MTIDEGYIKYECIWHKAPPPDIKYLKEINRWRKKLFDKKLIGVYEDSGIGYGNISIRHPENQRQFIITGTQTGALNILNPWHFSIVTSYDIDKNQIYCSGLIKSSSEALTHAMIYELEDGRYNSVIHVHHYEMWKQLKNKVPTTSNKIAYGTKDMGFEIKRLYNTGNLKTEKILIMAGHEEGIITFGNTLEESGDILLHYLSKVYVK